MNIIYDLFRVINKKITFNILCSIVIIMYNYYMFINLEDTYYISYLYLFKTKNFIEILCMLLYYVSILLPIYTYMKIELSSYSDYIITRISKSKYEINKCIVLVLYSFIISIITLLITLLAELLFKIEINNNLFEVFKNNFQIIFLIVFSTFTLSTCIKDISKVEIISIVAIFFMIIINNKYNILNSIKHMYFFIIISEMLLISIFIRGDKIGIKKEIN